MLKVELGLVDGTASAQGHRAVQRGYDDRRHRLRRHAGQQKARASPRRVFVFGDLGSMPVLPALRGPWCPVRLGVGAFLGGALGAGYSGVTPLLLTSLFPAELRARAVGLVYHVGAFGAAFVPMGMAAFAETTGTGLGQNHRLGGGDLAAGPGGVDDLPTQGHGGPGQQRRHHRRHDGQPLDRDRSTLTPAPAFGKVGG
jgi:hypothetical protein